MTKSGQYLDNKDMQDFTDSGAVSTAARLAAVCLKGEIYFTAGTSAKELICLSHKSPLPSSLTCSVGLGWVSGMAHISSVTPQALCQDCAQLRNTAQRFALHTLAYAFYPSSTHPRQLKELLFHPAVARSHFQTLFVYEGGHVCVQIECMLYPSLSCCLAEAG